MVGKFIGSIIFKSFIYGCAGTKRCTYNNIVFQLPDSVTAGDTSVKIIIIKLQGLKALNISSPDKL